MKKIIVISFILVAFFSCDNFYKSYLDNEFKPLEYNMVVTNKYNHGRYYRIVGRETSGKIDTTELSAIDEDEYALIEIGDTLVKEKNKIILVIIKKDTTYEITKLNR